VNYELVSKKDITEKIIKEIPKETNPFLERDIDKIIFAWWFTSNNSGLRLTDLGFKAFTLANIVYYEFDFVIRKSWNQTILEYSKKLKCPYYITANKKIYIYDDEIAVLINLYGSVFEYIDSIKDK
jgi:hypothetical protein